MVAWWRILHTQRETAMAETHQLPSTEDRDCWILSPKQDTVIPPFTVWGAFWKQGQKDHKSEGAEECCDELSSGYFMFVLPQTQ